MLEHEGLPQSAMTAQSPEPLSVKTDMIPDYYPMAPNNAVNNSQQSFYNPSFPAINPPFQSPAMSQTTTWASPRSSVDDFDNYSYRAPAPTSGYHAGSISPRTWPDSVQTPPSQFELPFHHQTQYDGIASDHMTMTSNNLGMTSLDISIDFNTPLTGSHDGLPMKYESPPAVNTSCGPFVTSPTSIPDPFKTDHQPAVSSSPVPPVPPGGIASDKVDSESNKSKKNSGDVPYAQLIWKCLMEQESRSLPLQGIYQWFIDNTDKPEKAKDGAEKGKCNGWHSSIRHNLSQNEAFQKEVLPRHSLCGSLNEKNPSRWHLVPGFEDGVKSTTQYRPKSRGASGRRRKNGTNRHSYHSAEFPNRIIPGRALSGRRGGRATSRSRNAARDLRNCANLQEQEKQQKQQEQQQQQQQHWNTLQRNISTSHIKSYPAYLDQHSQNAQRYLRDQGRQPEEAAPNVISALPMRSSGSASQQPYQIPGYTMANLAGVYHHPHHPQHFQQQPPHPGQQSEEVLYSGWSNSTH